MFLISTRGIAVADVALMNEESRSALGSVTLNDISKLSYAKAVCKFFTDSRSLRPASADKDLIAELIDVDAIDIPACDSISTTFSGTNAE